MLDSYGEALGNRNPTAKFVKKLLTSAIHLTICGFGDVSLGSDMISTSQRHTAVTPEEVEVLCPLARIPDCSLTPPTSRKHNGEKVERVGEGVTSDPRESSPTHGLNSGLQIVVMQKFCSKSNNNDIDRVHCIWFVYSFIYNYNNIVCIYIFMHLLIY